MHLSDLSTVVPFEIRRDALFETLGLLSDDQEAKLVFLEDKRHLGTLLRSPGVRAVITVSELEPKLDAVPALAVSDDPRRAFYEIHNYLARSTDHYWRDFPTEIDPAARVHPRAYVAGKNVRIGAGTVVEPNATILERCIIGANVIVHSGAVLGAIGFQSTVFGEKMLDMDHAGSVVVEDGAHILANAAIARAVFRQATTIGTGARIGSSAFVSHNVRVGPRAFVGHGAVVSGNVRIGEEAWIGPGATLTHLIRVGARAHVSLGAAVIADVAAGQRVTGSVAIDHASQMRHIASLRRRPDH